MHTPTPLVVFSHLRWDFVFQRPQHLMTRIARHRPVLFVEEPILDVDGKARWEVRQPVEGVTVAQPRTPVVAPGFAGEQMDILRPMMAGLLQKHAPGDYDAWFYSPMAVPLLDEMTPDVVIYDCMDELSAFKFAPPELLDRERDLLARANVVFTGGPSLFRAKKDRHRNCYCFPSSVETRHYEQATRPDRVDPADQAGIPRPRLGYFGVIDERFDLGLLAGLAAARPDWHFVLVGPVAKIEDRDLPRLPNIHYLGQKSYQQLPDYLGGWEVALLPFARNESTRFISPTKTLEYMAADKPIVSTPITDVAEPYGTMVGLGDTVETFLAACERALGETPDEAERRREQYRSVLSRTSWDHTVDSMGAAISAAANCKRYSRSAERAAERPFVVIGAGPTGLSAAYHLGEESLLIEANDRVGGWCRSLVDNGFTFDYAGHIMFSNDPYVHQMYETLLGDNVHWQDREAWIYSKDVFTRYPFQGSLYGLPADVITECLVGAIEARFGKLNAVAVASPPKPVLNGHASANGHAGNGACKPTRVANDKGDEITDCCGDGVAEGTVPLVNRISRNGDGHATEPRNFEEFIYKVWGAGIAKHFAIPYNQKIWAVPLTEMETSWLGGRVPMPDLKEMIEGALSPKPKPMGPNARFGYPLRGGFQALMDGFLPRLRGDLWLNSRVKSVSVSRRVVTLTDGTDVPYEQLVSTMPLPVLIRAMGDEVPAPVRRAAAALRHTSVRCVNIGVGREAVTEKHWIYYPEDTVFHRIFVQGNASPHCNPPGGFGLTCEITYGPRKPLPCDGDALIRRCIDDCIATGLLRPDDEIWAANQVDMPFAYVVYDHARPKNVALIREWLDQHDIHLAGRYSEWEYYNSDHAFLAGKRVADEVRNRRVTIAPSPVAAQTQLAASR